MIIYDYCIFNNVEFNNCITDIIEHNNNKYELFKEQRYGILNNHIIDIIESDNEYELIKGQCYGALIMKTKYNNKNDQIFQLIKLFTKSFNRHFMDYDDNYDMIALLSNNVVIGVNNKFIPVIELHYMYNKNFDSQSYTELIINIDEQYFISLTDSDLKCIPKFYLY